MRINAATGFTIVEVLVAIIVLALGLIGGTAMQLAALRTRHQSALLSSAVRLASGTADRMRANAPQLLRADSQFRRVGIDRIGHSIAAWTCADHEGQPGTVQRPRKFGPDAGNPAAHRDSLARLVLGGLKQQDAAIDLGSPERLGAERGELPRHTGLRRVSSNIR